MKNYILIVKTEFLKSRFREWYFNNCWKPVLLSYTYELIQQCCNMTEHSRMNPPVCKTAFTKPTIGMHQPMHREKPLQTVKTFYESITKFRSD